MQYRTLIVVITVALLVSGCSNLRIADFTNTEPRLTLEEYFEGELYAWGMFQDRTGAVRKRFTVFITGERSGNQLTLDEAFCYSDGSRERRVWVINRVGPGRYVGRADDVIGEAVGESAGNALHWTYQMALPINGRVFHVTFEDWMFLQSSDILINRAVMKKWGVRLGEVTLVFNRQAPTQTWDQACAAGREHSA